MEKIEQIKICFRNLWISHATRTYTHIHTHTYLGWKTRIFNPIFQFFNSYINNLATKNTDHFTAARYTRLLITDGILYFIPHSLHTQNERTKQIGNFFFLFMYIFSTCTQHIYFFNVVVVVVVHYTRCLPCFFLFNSAACQLCGSHGICTTVKYTTSLLSLCLVCYFFFYIFSSLKSQLSLPSSSLQFESALY